MHDGGFFLHADYCGLLHSRVGKGEVLSSEEFSEGVYSPRINGLLNQGFL